MDREQIIKEADKWLITLPANRAQIVIMTEQTSGGAIPRVSFSAGGNNELLRQAVCETLKRFPQFAAILSDALQRYSDSTPTKYYIINN